VLAAGRLPRDAYADLTIQHHFIYRALELAAARMAGSPFVSDEVAGLPAIEADLRFLYDPQWRGGSRRCRPPSGTSPGCTP
jgi:heme oxygenase